jgi:hypothetical protein
MEIICKGLISIMENNPRPVDRFKILWNAHKLEYFYHNDRNKWIEELAIKMHNSINNDARLRKLVQEEIKPK